MAVLDHAGTGQTDRAEGTGGHQGGKVKEIRSVLRMAYEAGRAKGREEARRELLGLVGPSAASAIPADNSNAARGVERAKVF